MDGLLDRCKLPSVIIAGGAHSGGVPGQGGEALVPIMFWDKDSLLIVFVTFFLQIQLRGIHFVY